MKGRDYQRAVKDWLAGRPLFGLETRMLGDVYDATRTASDFCGESFDFSLALESDRSAHLVLYSELKYRNPSTSDTSKLLREFLSRVCTALSKANSDERDEAVFMLITNVPPDDYRPFIRDRDGYCREHLQADDDCEDDVVAIVARSAHALVIPRDLIGARKSWG